MWGVFGADDKKPSESRGADVKDGAIRNYSFVLCVGACLPQRHDRKFRFYVVFGACVCRKQHRAEKNSLPTIDPTDKADGEEKKSSPTVDDSAYNTDGTGHINGVGVIIIYVRARKAGAYKFIRCWAAHLAQFIVRARRAGAYKIICIWSTSGLNGVNLLQTRLA